MPSLDAILRELEQLVDTLTLPEDWSKTVQFELLDEESLEIRTLIIRFENGKGSIINQEIIDFDVRIQVEKLAWKRLISGELPVFAAFMARKIKTNGRTEDLLALAPLLVR